MLRVIQILMSLLCKVTVIEPETLKTKPETKQGHNLFFIPFGFGLNAEGNFYIQIFFMTWNFLT